MKTMADEASRSSAAVEYSCKSCRESFRSKTMLTRHRIDKHPEEVQPRTAVAQDKKSLLCPYCDYRTEPKYRLKAMVLHIKSRHKDKTVPEELLREGRRYVSQIRPNEVLCSTFVGIFAHFITFEYDMSVNHLANIAVVHRILPLFRVSSSPQTMVIPPPHRHRTQPTTVTVPESTFLQRMLQLT